MLPKIESKWGRHKWLFFRVCLFAHFLHKRQRPNSYLKKVPNQSKNSHNCSLGKYIFALVMHSYFSLFCTTAVNTRLKFQRGRFVCYCLPQSTLEQLKKAACERALCERWSESTMIRGGEMRAYWGHYGLSPRVAKMHDLVMDLISHFVR